MSATATKMECVFEDVDMTTLVLKGLFGDYVEEAKRPYNDRRGPSRPSPEMRMTTLRTMLRQTVCFISRSSHVCKLWKTASTAAFRSTAVSEC